jgi:phosphoribosylaminoimidazole-succinocarboxamide synthase
MPAEFTAQVAARYIQVYEQLTGKPFQPGETPTDARIARNLAAYHPMSPMGNKN